MPAIKFKWVQLPRWELCSPDNPIYLYIYIIRKIPGKSGENRQSA